MTTIAVPQCAECRWFNPYQWTCKAFDVKIPDEILAGEHDHRQPFSGDNGIQFEKVENKGANDPKARRTPR